MIDLMDFVDEKLDVFNDLFLICLNVYVFVKIVKLKYKLNLFIIDDIKDFMKIRDFMYRKVWKIGVVNDW